MRQRSEEGPKKILSQRRKDGNGRRAWGESPGGDGPSRLRSSRRCENPSALLCSSPQYSGCSGVLTTDLRFQHVPQAPLDGLVGAVDFLVGQGFVVGLI